MFITFEGPEGSGKTSQIPALAEFLRQRGFSVYTTREPGGTAIGEQIRAVIHDLKNEEMHPRTETLLYQAARAQVVEQVIRPRLAAGEVVLCDRYMDSTLAYQGYGHRQHLEEVRTLIRYATGGLRPDLTILLDLAVEEGLKRKTHQDEWNRLDAYTVDFHCRVREGYHALAREDPARWVVVDAEQAREGVQAALREVVLARVGGIPHRRSE